MRFAGRMILRDSLVQRLIHGQRGATAIEYALLIALIAIAAAGSFQILGQHERATFANAASAMPGGMSISVDDGQP